MSFGGGRFLLLGIIFNFFLGLMIILNSLDQKPQTHSSNSEVVILSYESKTNRVRKVNEALWNKNQQSGNFAPQIIDYYAMKEKEEKVAVSNGTENKEEEIVTSTHVESINHTHSDIPSNKCHFKTCYQIITGRYLSYARALEIVQSEKYLSAIDKNLIEQYAKTRTKRSEEITKKVRKSVYEEQDYDYVVDDKKNQNNLAAQANSMLNGLVSAFSKMKKNMKKKKKQKENAQRSAGANTPANRQLQPDFQMTPEGTETVAVFPPFDKPRTFDSMAVIFKESSPEIHPQGRFSSNSSSRVGYSKDQGQFGFRAKIYLLENQPCKVGLNCETKSDLPGPGEESSTEFTSESPPECTVTTKSECDY